MKKAQKKMEIEDLALVVQAGFKDIDTKFKDINTKLESVVNKTELEDLAVMVQKGFEEVYRRTASKEDLRDLENRLDDKIEGLGMRIGSYMSDCDENFDDIRESISELDIRVSKVEDKIVRIK